MIEDVFNELVKKGDYDTLADVATDLPASERDSVLEAMGILWHAADCSRSFEEQEKLEELYEGLSKLLCTEVYSDAEWLVEHAKYGCENNFADALLCEGYYEEVLDILAFWDDQYPSHEYSFDKYDIQCRLLDEDPVAALIYSYDNGDKFFEVAAERIINIYSDDKELCASLCLELCEYSTRHRSYQGITSELLGSIDKLTKMPLFGEIHQWAVEMRDENTLMKIAEELMDSQPGEARVLAEEAGDTWLRDVIEDREFDKIDDAIDNMMEESEEVRTYTYLLQTAEEIIDMVESAFDLELPKKVVKGGQQGSYATIRWSGGGGAFDATGS